MSFLAEALFEAGRKFRSLLGFFDEDNGSRSRRLKSEVEHFGGSGGLVLHLVERNLFLRLEDSPECCALLGIDVDVVPKSTGSTSSNGCGNKEDAKRFAYVVSGPHLRNGIQ